jgi:dipeptidyl aminopeptidase/acylaminoacyl peptidase
VSHRAVELEDLFRLKFLQSAELSPDGKRVVYAVSHISKDKDDDKEKEKTTLYLLTIATGDVRQLTSGRTSDGDPHWSPDGTQIAFVSARPDKAQIYVIPVDGGEARQVTEFKQGVGGGIAWSPDGTRIAFTASPLTEEHDPSAPFRVTRNVYRFNGAGYIDQVRQEIYVVDVATGESVRLTNDEASNGGAVWSPDGEKLLYTASMLPDQFEPFGRMRIVNMNGDVRDVVSPDWGIGMAASWLPDGRLVMMAHLKGQRNGTKHDLWVVDPDGGTPENRSASSPLGFGDGLQADLPALGLGQWRPLVTPDGKWAYAARSNGGTGEIARVALSGPEKVEAIITGERDAALLSVSEDGILYAINTLQRPPDLFFAKLDGADEQQLTDINRDLLARLHETRVEHLLFPSVDGTEVEGWIMLPNEGEAPYPTILYIHGGPHSGFGHTYSFDFQMLAGAGYAVLFINHRGSTGYGDAFGSGALGDWGNLDYHDLMAGVDVAIEKGFADPNRLGVCGLSGGGNLSCWIVGQTDRFKAAVPENPVTNWVSFYGVSDIGVWFGKEELGGSPYEIPEVYARCSPITYANRCTTPTLLVQGEWDWRCPAEQSEQFYTVLKAHGCTVEMLRLPNSFHAGTLNGALPVRRAHNEALLDWFRKYV